MRSLLSFGRATSSSGSTVPDDDARLLREFASTRSEAAFTELVRRHTDLVYSAALRRCGGNTDQAEEVAQQVFTRVAQNAARLVEHPALVAWLHTATRNASINVQISEARRRERETEAMTRAINPTDAGPDWRELRQVIDAVIDELGEADRTAVLLRFFEGRSFAEIGAKLNVSENTARMRTERALDKLRAQLQRRGIRSTVAVLGASLAAEAISLAPSYLANRMATEALRGGPGSATAATTHAASAAIPRILAVVSLSLLTMVGVILALRLPSSSQLAPRPPVIRTPAPGNSPPLPARADVPPTPRAEIPPPAKSADGGRVASAVSPIRAPLDAADVLRRMLSAYRALSSYQDEAECTIYDNFEGKPMVRATSTSSLQFARTKRFRLEWLTPPPSQAAAGTQALIASDGYTVFINLLYPHRSDRPSFVQASLFATNNGASFYTLYLLEPSIPRVAFSVERLHSPQLRSTPELVEDTLCYVIGGDQDRGPTWTLWVSQTDFLLRKIVTRWPFTSAVTYRFKSSPSNTPPPAILEEIHRNIQINPTIDSAVFNPDTPERVPAP